MNLLKCSKGHFYDSDTYANCPHCNTQMSDTIKMEPIIHIVSSSHAGGSDGVTVSRGFVEEELVTMKKKIDEEPVTRPKTDTGWVPDLPDEEVTVDYYGQRLAEQAAIDPVVGWLVCTKGKYFGQGFNLRSGRNFVGREWDMDVCLDGEASVSRYRHAVIIYEPVSRVFFAQAGESSELFHVNDKVVLDNVQLEPYDVISLGKVNLTFIPCCTKEFAWDNFEKDTEK